MNKQRETIYAIRRSALEGKDQRDYVLQIAEDVARELVETYCPREQHPDQWNVAQFLAEANAQFGLDIKAAGVDPSSLGHDELVSAAVTAVTKRYEEKEKQFGPELMRWLERRIILDVVDSQWKDHLLSLDHLKEGIGLRGYGQKDPLVEFKKEGFVLFEDMMARIDNETIRYLYHIQLQQGEPPQVREPRRQPPRQPPSAAAAAVASAAARAARNRQTCRDSRAKWNAGNSASSRICSTKRARRRRKRQSPFARAQKWGATILARAGQAKSTRNATAPECMTCLEDRGPESRFDFL